MPQSSPLLSPPQRPLIAISGLSNTGKTTLTKHLSRIFSPSPTSVAIIHQDDFFLPQSDLPLSPCGRFRDWERPAAVDWTSLRAAVAGARSGVSVVGLRPHPVASDASGGGGQVAGGVILELRDRAQKAVGGKGVVLLDGFLLFGDEVGKGADVKILLRARQEVAKERREGRVYDTDDGDWTDPPGYWDEVAWPAYVEAHSHLFVNNDVEGELTDEAVSVLGIRSPGVDWTMEEVLKWSVDVIVKGLEEEGGRTGGEVM